MELREPPKRHLKAAEPPDNTSTSTGSSESPSQSPPQAGLPSPLPPAKRQKGRPPVVAQAVEAVTREAPKRRKLPSDPKELEDAAGTQKVMARTFIVMLNKMNEVVGVSRFDKDETETLLLGIGAMLYEEGANLSGRSLCALSLAGVYTPRLAEKAAQLRERRKKEAASKGELVGGVRVPPPPPSASVQ